jgi:hypothetical protein
MALPDSPTAPTDERDVATIVVRTLCDGGHAGSEYVVTDTGRAGPDDRLRDWPITAR